LYSFPFGHRQLRAQNGIHRRDLRNLNQMEITRHERQEVEDEVLKLRQQDVLKREGSAETRSLGRCWELGGVRMGLKGLRMASEYSTGPAYH
jgi:hypothetical protein